MDDVESSILLAPGAGRSSDDLEEDPGFHRVPSRYVRHRLLAREREGLEPSTLLVPDVTGLGGGTGSKGNFVRRFSRFTPNSSGKVAFCQNQKPTPQLSTWVPAGPHRHETCRGAARGRRGGGGGGPASFLLQVPAGQ